MSLLSKVGVVVEREADNGCCNLDVCRFGGTRHRGWNIFFAASDCC